MPILLDNVKCRGDESTIAACRHNGWRQNDCDHSEDASVVCWRETAPPVQGTAFKCNNFYQNLSVTYFHQNAFFPPNSYEEQQFTNSLVLPFILIRSTKCIKTYSNELGCKKIPQTLFSLFMLIFCQRLAMLSKQCRRYPKIQKIHIDIKYCHYRYIFYFTGPTLAPGPHPGMSF